MLAGSRRRLATRSLATALLVTACLACAVSAGCGLTIEGSAEPDGGPVDSSPIDGGAGTDGGAEGGGAAEGGTTPDASVDAPAGDAAPSCIASAPGMLGWWTADTDMVDRAGAHTGVSGTQGGATPVTHGPGEVAGAFDLKGTSYVQIANTGNLQLTSAVTMEAWIFATALGGRIFDKITAGGSDGYMLDTYQSKLRIILGGFVMSSPAVLPIGAWTHVAGTWDGANATLYVNGLSVATAPATTPMVKNGLALRLGADSTGATRWNGKLDEVGLYGRGLGAAEIAAIAAAGPLGRCK